MLPVQTINPDFTWKYLADESNAFHAKADKVQAVYAPQNTAEVAEVLRECNRKGIPCTVSGAGTGITGSRVPLCGGVVLSMERMRHAGEHPNTEKIVHKSLSGELSLALNRQTSSVFAPSGISLDSLREALPKEFFYPLDPTESTASLGGTAATNASGARSFYYGATRRWIRSLEVVLPDGEILSIARNQVRADENRSIRFCSDSGNDYQLHLPGFDSPQIKNAAGVFSQPQMDLVDLFIGSEGIFGIITGLELALAPMPSKIIANLTFFKGEEQAIAFADDLRQAKERGILSVEYFDENSLRFMQGKGRKVDPEWGAAIFVEMVENESTLEWLSDICQTHQSQNDWFAESERELKELKEFRHALPEGVNSYLKQHQSSKLGTDFVVPLQHFPAMMDVYRQTGQLYKHRFPREGMHFVLFGHIGDCHLHFNFITHNSQELQFARELYRDMAEKAVAMGGTISGEHGVGKKTIVKNGSTVPYLELMVGRKGLEEIAAIKDALDPKGILNVGNVIGNK